MPGPNSAPNGDRSLVDGIVYFDEKGKVLDPPVRKREWMRNKKQLYTGKTRASK